jgi:hypothetical protein
VKTLIEIIDNRSGSPVAAELFDEVTVEHFIETQQEWRPIILRAARELARQGSRELIPQHFHWDWTVKAPQLSVLANTFYGIRFEKKLQGLEATIQRHREPVDRGGCAQEHRGGVQGPNWPALSPHNRAVLQKGLQNDAGRARLRQTEPSWLEFTPEQARSFLTGEGL